MDSLSERILDAVATIPSGRVLSYGDVAELAGLRSARQVGRVMALHGAQVCWHRVVHADGSLAARVHDEQRQLLLAESVPFTASGRVQLDVARWSPQESELERGPTAGEQAPQHGVVPQYENGDDRAWLSR